MGLPQLMYAPDPVRRRLIRELTDLVQAAGAQRGGLVWAPAGEAAPVHRHLVIGSAEEGPWTRTLDDVPRIAKAATLVGRLRGGQTRNDRLAALFLTEKEGALWFLFLSGDRRLNLGREIGDQVERVAWRSVSALIELDDATVYCGEKSPQDWLAHGQWAEGADRAEDALAAYRAGTLSSLAHGNAPLVGRSRWLVARMLRNLGRLPQATTEFALALSVAEAVGDRPLQALVHGAAAYNQFMLGNYPAAREGYKTSIDLTHSLDPSDPDVSLAISSGHHGMMSLLRQVGEHQEAICHGWKAFGAAQRKRDRLSALVALGTAWREIGDLDASELAYEVAIASDPTQETRILALDALAFVSALRGDEAGYRSRLRRIPDEELQDSSVSARTQIALFRGRAEARLGYVDAATAHAQDALRLAEEHRLGKLIHDADALLSSLAESPEQPRPVVAPVLEESTAEVKRELRALHETVLV